MLLVFLSMRSPRSTPCRRRPPARRRHGRPTRSCSPRTLSWPRAASAEDKTEPELHSRSSPDHGRRGRARSGEGKPEVGAALLHPAPGDAARGGPSRSPRSRPSGSCRAHAPAHRTALLRRHACRCARHTPAVIGAGSSAPFLFSLTSGGVLLLLALALTFCAASLELSHATSSCIFSRGRPSCVHRSPQRKMRSIGLGSGEDKRRDRVEQSKSGHSFHIIKIR
jgi:hypothetical protein